MLKLCAAGPRRALPVAVLAAGALACAPTPVPPTVETRYTVSPPTWFEDGWSFYRVAPEEDRALFGARFGLRLIDLERARDDSILLRRPLDVVFWATFDSRGRPIRLGVRGRDTAWFAETAGGPAVLPVPRDAVPRWSPDGSRVAWYTSGGGEVMLGPEPARRIPVAGSVTGLEWSVSGDAVYALLVEGDGSSTLVRVRVDGDSAETVRRGLDAPHRFSGLGVGPDDRTLYLALAGEEAPDDAARHRPDADRDTDIYALDLASGRLDVVAQGPGDDFHPQVIRGRLYWTHNELRDDVVMVPTQGGEARVVVEGAQIPYWSPDGHRLAFTVGGWRIADWALNLDAAVVEVAPAGVPASPPVPFVVGTHEDFTPAWSPDGRWIVYHSHRSARPVSGYSAQGSTDDLYLRRADAPMTEEVRLTDFGWEVGVADWAPDGTRLVFDSWERGGAPGLSQPWIATIDPATGSRVRLERLPVPGEVLGTLFLSWSPSRDRDEIAFIAEGEGPLQSLWIVTSSGGNPRKLLDFRSATYGGLDWTPDGEGLVFAGLADDRMQLFEVPRGGGVPRQLTRDPHGLIHPQVSPDGRWIAATRIRRSMQLRRLDGIPGG